MKKDNKAFSVECRQSATEKEEQRASRKNQEPSWSGDEVSVSDAKQVADQEMQEKPGSSLLNANTGNATGSWTKGEVEASDHVEHAKPT